MGKHTPESKRPQTNLGEPQSTSLSPVPTSNINVLSNASPNWSRSSSQKSTAGNPSAHNSSGSSKISSGSLLTPQSPGEICLSFMEAFLYIFQPHPYIAIKFISQVKILAWDTHLVKKLEVEGELRWCTFGLCEDSRSRNTYIRLRKWFQKKFAALANKLLPMCPLIQRPRCIYLLNNVALCGSIILKEFSPNLQPLSGISRISIAK